MNVKELLMSQPVERKEIWLALTAELARKRAYDVIDAYAKRFPKAIQCLENG